MLYKTAYVPSEIASSALRTGWEQEEKQAASIAYSVRACQGVAPGKSVHPLDGTI